MFQNSKLNPWKLILVTLGLAFTACTQGQQGGGGGAAGGGEQPKVTLSGVETPATDDCEKPENLNNILCQWVATEMKVTVGGKLEALINLTYDDKGRPIYFTGFDKDGKKELVGGLFFNDSGVIKIVNFSSPDPVGSENYTSEQTTSTSYNPDGSIHDVNLEVKNKGAVSYTSNTTYNYLPQSSLIMKIKTDRDASGTVTNACNIKITTDAGKNKSIDQECGIPGMTGGPIKNKSASTLDYYTDSGKLKSIHKQNQDCGVKPCGTQLEPTNESTVQMSYEGDHLSLYSISTEGSVDYSTSPPTVSNIGDPPNPDVFVECGFTYDLQTQGKVAYMNPFQLFLMMYPTEEYQMDFGDHDYFDTFSCSVGGTQQVLMDIKWVHLWEALPGGKAPGGS